MSDGLFRPECVHGPDAHAMWDDVDDLSLRRHPGCSGSTRTASMATGPTSCGSTSSKAHTSINPPSPTAAHIRRSASPVRTERARDNALTPIFVDALSFGASTVMPVKTGVPIRRFRTRYDGRRVSERADISTSGIVQGTDTGRWDPRWNAQLT